MHIRKLEISGFKSFVALDWACHVAAGKPWRGKPVRISFGVETPKLAGPCASDGWWTRTAPVGTE